LSRTCGASVLSFSPTEVTSANDSDGDVVYPRFIP
jgi:hypothetical protein